MAFFEAKGLGVLPQVLMNGVQLDLEEVREREREREREGGRERLLTVVVAVLLYKNL